MLTQRQLQLLQFIHAYQTEKGVPPSFDEMRASLRLRSKSGIHRLISGLEERGYIRRLAYRARAIEVVRPPLEVTEGGAKGGAKVVRPNFKPQRHEDEAASLNRLPLLGRIAAGTPIEALADGSTSVDVPSLLMGEGEHYVVQVLGESMIEAGIQDGDLAVIQRADEAQSGEIVVALIDDREVTLKRLRRKHASIALEPANPAFETRIFGPQRVKVQGRLVGLMRRY